MNEDDTYRQLSVGHIPHRLKEISEELKNLDHGTDIEKLMLETRALMQKMAEVDFPELKNINE